MPLIRLQLRFQLRRTISGLLTTGLLVTGGTGYLYVCGTAGSLNALWQIHVDGSTVDPPFLGPTLTTANTGCSPITEFFDGTTDRMFLSVTGSAQTAAPISCPTNTGCVMSFSTDPVAFSPTSAPIARAPEAGEPAVSSSITHRRRAVLRRCTSVHCRIKPAPRRAARAVAPFRLHKRDYSSSSREEARI